MAKSTFLKLGVPVTGDHPVYNANDSWVDNGTLFLFDFGKTACWPTQANPGDGAVFNNLVDGAPSLTSKVTSSGITFLGGALKFGGVANNWLDLGDNYNIASLGATTPNVLYTIWMKRETGFSAAHYQRVIGRATSVNSPDIQFNFSLGVSGINLTFQFQNAAGAISGYALPTGNNGPLDTFIQWGVAFEGGVVKVFKNGTLVASGTPTIAGPMNSLTGQHMYVGGLGSGSSFTPLKAVIARIGMTNLTTTGKTAQERITADYNANHLRITGV